MKLQFLNKELSVCKVNRITEIGGEFLFTARTDNENSVVCETAYVPNNTFEREDGWTAFRIEGQIDFSLTGILSPIARILADKCIGIFAVSTFDTDYVLIKKVNEDKALKALSENGYVIEKM